MFPSFAYMVHLHSGYLNTYDIAMVQLAHLSIVYDDC